MWKELLAGCLLAALGMLLALGLIRLAANAVIILVMVATCGYVIHQISFGVWTGWGEICLYSLLSGGAGGLLTLPVLPFSGFHRRKR